MNELVKITINELGSQIVNGREMYDALGLDAANWSRWSDKNIVNNQFAVENEDWVPLFIEKRSPSDGRLSQNYVLRLDFAKRLAMQVRTKKGEEIRGYFIQCEKDLKDKSVKLPSPKEMAIMFIKAEEEKEQALLALEQKNEQLQLANSTIEIQAPKVQYVNEVLASNTSITTTTIAKELGMSAVKLNEKLKSMGVQFFHSNHWVLYAKYADQGYAKTKTHTYYDSENRQQTSIQLVWTEKGRMFIHQLLKETAAA